MAEYIEREAVNALIEAECSPKVAAFLNHAIDNIPAADVRPVWLLEQVEWERDTALAQLAEIGKSLGEKMDDVRPVVRGKWISGDARDVTAVCSNCGRLRLGNGAESATKYAPFCEKCGAYMREES